MLCCLRTSQQGTAPGKEVDSYQGWWILGAQDPCLSGEGASWVRGSSGRSLCCGCCGADATSLEAAASGAASCRPPGCGGCVVTAEDLKTPFPWVQKRRRELGDRIMQVDQPRVCAASRVFEQNLTRWGRTSSTSEMCLSVCEFEQIGFLMPNCLRAAITQMSSRCLQAADGRDLETACWMPSTSR